MIPPAFGQAAHRTTLWLDGQWDAAESAPFSLPALGAEFFLIALNAPGSSGKYSLQAIASATDDPDHSTISHRDVTVEPAVAQK